MSNLLFVEEDASTSSNALEILCKICKAKPWKYTCPRCNINYCTVPCYQSEAHGTCSEAFYRDCIMEEMGAEVGNPESERKMMEILVRMQQESTTDQLESDDEECEPDLADRLSSVNLDDANAVWEKLTEAERKEFEQLVHSGDASELVPPWTPWWEFKPEKRLVIDVDDKPDEVMSYAKNCPKLKRNVKSLLQITSVPPSPVVCNSAVNVAAAYCVAARWLNGRLGAAETEAAHALAALSGALAEGRSYKTIDMATTDVAQRALDCPWLGFTPAARLEMVSDVRAVFRGPEPAQHGFYLSALLSDSLALFKAAARAGKAGNAKTNDRSCAQTNQEGCAQNSKEGTDQDDKTSFSRRFGPDVSLPLPASATLKAASRKLDYLLSWAISGGVDEVCGEGVLEMLEGKEVLGL